MIEKSTKRVDAKIASLQAELAKQLNRKKKIVEYQSSEGKKKRFRSFCDYIFSFVSKNIDDVDALIARLDLCVKVEADKKGIVYKSFQTHKEES